VHLSGTVVHTANAPRVSSGSGIIAARSVSIDRGDLAQRLLDKASAHPRVRVHYRHTLTALDVAGGAATFSVGGDGGDGDGGGGGAAAAQQRVERVRLQS
jgi:2-polyprenyl-6-methoxyphenol hydroxylase-like FAD-dependent oxidoreductase